MSFHKPEGDKKLLLLREAKENGASHIAVVGMTDGRLSEYMLFPEGSASLVGNIYHARISKYVPSLDACFVSLTEELTAFLPAEEIHFPFLTNRSLAEKTDASPVRLKEGDTLFVQVVNDAVKTKDAVCTTDISLAGEYVVLRLAGIRADDAANLPRAGFSGKYSPAFRERVRKWYRAHGALFCVSGAYLSPLFRTRLETDAETDGFARMEAEVSALNARFEEILRARFLTARREVYRERAPYLAYLEKRAAQYDELVTEDAALYEEAWNFFSQRVQALSLRLYTDKDYPLTVLYGLKSKREALLQKKVWLPCGGNLIIEQGEAFTMIDVNTASFSSKRKTPEETIRKINEEALAEAFAQIRLRNLSGMILIDFINMDGEGEERLLALAREAAASDPVQTSVIDITGLGIMELTRKKLYPSLRELIARDA